MNAVWDSYGATPVACPSLRAVWALLAIAPLRFVTAIVSPRHCPSSPRQITSAIRALALLFPSSTRLEDKVDHTCMWHVCSPTVGPNLVRPNLWAWIEIRSEYTPFSTANGLGQVDLILDWPYLFFVLCSIRGRPNINLFKTSTEPNFGLKFGLGPFSQQ